jgi:hypothetical protein
VDALKAHRHLRGRFVFCQEDGQPLTEGKMKQPLRRALNRAGISREEGRIGWHDLRHTYASHLAMWGVPLKVIQELMGHVTIEMTERYAHLSPDTLREAVGVLDRPLPLAPACDIRATWRSPSPWGRGAGACSFPGAASWQEKGHQARQGLELWGVQAREEAQAACPQGTLLPQLPIDVLQHFVGPPHEGIKQTFLDTVGLPNSRWLKPNTFLGGRLSRIAAVVENPTAAEWAYFHSELNDGLSQTLLQLSPPNKLP